MATDADKAKMSSKGDSGSKFRLFGRKRSAEPTETEFDLTGILLAGAEAAPGALAYFSIDGEPQFASNHFKRLMAEEAEIFEAKLGETEETPLLKRLFQVVMEQGQSTEGHAPVAQIERCTARLLWDDSVYQANITMVSSAAGAPLGYRLDLFNVSAEVSLEENVSQLIENFKNGDIYSRVSLDLDNLKVRNPFLISVSKDLNALLDTFCELFSDIEGAVLAMVAGDVTFKISGEYNGDFEMLKDNLNESIATFEQTIRGLHVVVHSMNDATGGAAAISSELSAHAERQKTAVAEVTSSLSDITDLIRNTAQSAERATELSDETAKRAQRGQEIVDASVEAMESIKDSSSKISDTISVIESIAFQTNLLALNAAVEAARAGDAGRGFSVVAQEVRQLAQRSSEAAKSIQDLIKESNERVARGSNLFSQTDEALGAIADAVRETHENVGRITDSAREQTSNAEAIVEQMRAIEDVIGKNAHISSQNRDVANTLTASTTEMKQMIEYFQVHASDDAIGAGPETSDFEGFDDQMSA